MEATGHIGVRDLSLGEPSHNNVKALSYCVIWAINLKCFNEIFEHDENLLEEVEKRKATILSPLLYHSTYQELLNLIYFGFAERKS